LAALAANGDLETVLETLAAIRWIDDEETRRSGGVKRRCGERR
jgi:hypothetical protein